KGHPWRHRARGERVNWKRPRCREITRKGRPPEATTPWWKTPSIAAADRRSGLRASSRRRSLSRTWPWFTLPSRVTRQTATPAPDDGGYVRNEPPMELCYAAPLRHI